MTTHPVELIGGPRDGDVVQAHLDSKMLNIPLRPSKTHTYKSGDGTTKPTWVTATYRRTGAKEMVFVEESE